MGEWYDFEIRFIDGREVSGFSYADEDTGWNDIFVEMTEDQCNLANKWQQRATELHDIKMDMIKGWIRGVSL